MAENEFLMYILFYFIFILQIMQSVKVCGEPWNINLTALFMKLNLFMKLKSLKQ